MQPQNSSDYKQLLTDVIKKQIVILGPDITLIKARNVAGLTVDDQGNVTAITGEPQQITQALIDQFVQLSGLIVKKTMEPLLMYHTADGTPAPAPTASAAQTPPTPVVTTPMAAAPTPTSSPAPMPTAPISQSPITPPMPQGTQPISDAPIEHQTNDSMPAAIPTSPMSAPVNSTSAMASMPVTPETDLETQKIINEALQQT